MLEQISAVMKHGRISRIDVGLEGDWSATVSTVWSRDRGFLGFDEVPRRHPLHQPCLELYFEHSWLGLHCFMRHDAQNVFDEPTAERVIHHVEAILRAQAGD